MTSSNRCSMCRKAAGTCFCRGCQELFCDDDFKDHRGMLINKLDELIVDRDDLQEKMNQVPSQNQSGNSFLSQIDEWKRTTVKKVERAADQAQQQVLQIFSKPNEIKRQFRTMSEEMEELRITKGVVEEDLTRLEQQIDQISRNLRQLSQLPLIQLNMKHIDQIEWYHMICVEEKPACTDYQQGQSQPREKQRRDATSASTKLECNGHSCSKCGKCRDWYFFLRLSLNRASWKRHDGSICTWDPPLYGYYSRWQNHRCECKN